MRVVRLSKVLAAISALTLGSAVAAQTTPRAFAHVTVRDSTGVPISAAELTIKRGLRDVVARGSTDSAGNGLLSFEAGDSTDFQITMRKVGYQRTDRFFMAGGRDTAALELVVAPAKPSLATVRVTASRERDHSRWNSYHLDADEIENAGVPFLDAWDMVKRLRPVMLTSRGGCETGVQHVWVNGKRIRLPLRPVGMAAARATMNAPIRARFSYIPVSVLSDIAPEHIQEINYHDCFDTSMAAVGNNDAIFVVLKPGVEYRQDVGSMVVETAAVKP